MTREREEAEIIPLRQRMGPDTHRGHTELSRDERAIHSAIGDYGRYIVGALGVTRIEAYDENGQQAYVPWLAIFKGDKISDRVPAQCMVVSYGEDN